MSRPHAVREEVTVVLWYGQYGLEGKDRLEILRKYKRLFGLGLRNVRLEGEPSDWRIVADAYKAAP